MKFGLHFSFVGSFIHKSTVFKKTHNINITLFIKFYNGFSGQKGAFGEKL
jgi:hypothetical protein